MNRLIVRIISLTLSLALIMATTYTPTAIAINGDYGAYIGNNEQIESLNREYVEKNIQALVNLDKLSIPDSRNVCFTDKTIRSVKQLSDFNGYIYYIVEFNPYGYIIYDNNFTTALELNAAAKSPYLDYNDDLIYSGPKCYYVRLSGQPDDTQLQIYHTVLEEDIILSDDEYQTLLEDSNKRAATVNNVISTAKKTAEFEKYLSTDLFVSNNTKGTSFVELRQYQAIVNQNTTGFNTNNDKNCGYVAAALLTWYYYAIKGFTKLVPEKVFNKNLVKGIQNSRPGATWGGDLASALDDWSIKTGGAAYYDSLIGYCVLLPLSSSIYSLIASDRPVILLGRVIRPDNGNKEDHAITVTGVERVEHTLFNVDWYYWAHYGWGLDYNDVRTHEAVIIKGAIVYH